MTLTSTSSLSDAAIALLISTARSVADENTRARGLELGGLQHAAFGPDLTGMVLFEVSYHPHIKQVRVGFRPAASGGYLFFSAPGHVGHAELRIAELFAV